MDPYFLRNMMRVDTRLCDSDCPFCAAFKKTDDFSPKKFIF